MANIDKLKTSSLTSLSMKKSNREASFKDDLGADSLDIAELVMGEDEFDMEIPMKKLKKSTQ